MNSQSTQLPTPSTEDSDPLFASAPIAATEDDEDFLAGKSGYCSMDEGCESCQ